jgi:hypothetical protein
MGLEALLLISIMINSIGTNTSRELLIAGRPIAGAPESNSPVVMLPLAHILLCAGDNSLSPAHNICIRQR